LLASQRIAGLTQRSHSQSARFTAWNRFKGRYGVATVSPWSDRGEVPMGSDPHGNLTGITPGRHQGDTSTADWRGMAMGRWIAVFRADPIALTVSKLDRVLVGLGPSLSPSRAASQVLFGRIPVYGSQGLPMAGRYALLWSSADAGMRVNKSVPPKKHQRVPVVGANTTLRSQRLLGVSSINRTRAGKPRNGLRALYGASTICGSSQLAQSYTLLAKALTRRVSLSVWPA
jgi:hypothetical protein